MLFLTYLMLPIFTLFISSCQTSSQPKLKSCRDCHKEVLQADLKIREHDISCSVCHEGTEEATDINKAHKGLIKTPVADKVFFVCSECHKKETKEITNSQHYTYQKKVRFLLSKFGMNLPISSLPELISFLEKENFVDKKAKFVLDFLGKRCFTCHIFYEGDDYELTRRGKGCLACHRAHTYQKPRDEECLSCHYSIRIGMDYLGKTPHNWFEDYRSPFVEGKLPPRPYGIEYYSLKPDVHASLGLSCTDCHGKDEIMFGKKRANCLLCHKEILADGHIFHQGRVLEKVSCAVCHASFINQDEYKYCELVRDRKTAERFSEVFVQEASEIENYFLSLWKGGNPTQAMKDGLTGKIKDGLWLCFLENRTFERIKLGKDKNGKVCVVRRERIRLSFDNTTLFVDLSLCKFPHTIGKKANLFRSLEVIRDEVSKNFAK